jgi:ABC-type multidrug transport system fused ATPase/permease subunit
MYQTIESLLKGRTAILISHRFSTLRLADRIVVMEAGRIAEEGTHASLIDKNGLYASMYRASLARFDLTVSQPDLKAA